jgi:hypothetical protein
VAPASVIENLQFEFQTGNEKGTSFLQDVSDFAQHHLVGVIEEVLDELELDGYLVVPSIEIHLEVIDWSNRDLLKHKLRTALLNQLHFEIVSKSHLILPLNESGEDGNDSSTQKTKWQEDRWAHYLVYGHFPWWDAATQDVSFSLEKDLKRYLERSPNAFLSFLQSQKKEPYTLRIIFQRLKTILGQLYSGVLQKILSLPLRLEQIEELSRLHNYVKDLQQVEARHMEQSVWIVLIQTNTFNADELIEALAKLYQWPTELVWKVLLNQSVLLETQSPWLFAYLQQATCKVSELPEFLKNKLPEWYEKALRTVQALTPYLSLSKEKLIQLLFENSFQKRNIQGLLLALEMAEGKNSSHEILKALESFWNAELHADFKNEYAYTQLSQLLSEQKILEEETEKLPELDWILRYLKTGSLPWVQRNSTLEELEAFIMGVYDAQPAFFIQYFKKVDVYRFPQIWSRIQKQFSPALVEVFRKSLSIEAFEDKQHYKEHREKILALLFTQGLIPWKDLLDNNIDHALEVLITFYREDPVFFRRALRESKLLEHPDSKSKVIFILGERAWQFLEEQYGEISSQSGELTALKLEDLLSNFNELAFQLEYFFQHRRFSRAVIPSIEKILSELISIKTNESKLMLAAFYQRYPDSIQMLLPSSQLELLKTLLAGFTQEDGSDEEEEELPEILKKKTGSSDPELEKLLPTGTTLYIKNAGLVILHPFINRFFNLLKLTEKKKFIDSEAQEKAVHMLQYLIFEKKDTPEFELTLNKILCGMAPVMPVMKEIEVSTEEHELSLSLLKGVIENWPILKNTSIENFRASFLLREGKLTKEPDGWRLRVEEKGFDILMKQLPWSINTIKLPWMNEVIHVDWQS